MSDAKIAVIMGSQSDYSTMVSTTKVLKELNVKYKVLIVSAHRTPDRLYHFAKSAQDNGFEVIIAAAGGAAHLPGMVAALTYIPVIGVPIKSSTLNGIDSLLSIVQMPKGVPVATMSIGVDGAENAAIMAASILAIKYSDIRNSLAVWRDSKTHMVKEVPDEI